MSVPKPAKTLRRLVIVCGDQLDRNSFVFDGFDPETDAVVMTEAVNEATYIPQHKRRLALFFSAMRHFRSTLAADGIPVIYHRLDCQSPYNSLADGALSAIRDRDPAEVVLARPGDYRVLNSLTEAIEDIHPNLRLVEERHFLSTPREFSDFTKGRNRLIMENFYRVMRRRTGLLMDGDKPAGGAWNFDQKNRARFGKEGPGLIPRRLAFSPDKITRDVIEMVETQFPDSPGSLDAFDEPVTRENALEALDDFIRNRLADFGRYQDALWSGSTTLYHSRLSAAMNLKLLDPLEVCGAAIEAYEAGHAPINSVEGFVRQIIGWREFVRGVYWTEMPGYADLNALDATEAIPDCFWTGETRMACVADAMNKLLATGYAHHIERLMVLGLYLQLHGADPFKSHQWHMSFYLDAIDWVSMPNMLGMSQHADGGIVGTKPYCASGAYINRMGNHCSICEFDPKSASGENACPFTTLYWDFLDRHEQRFARNQRMNLQLANLRRKAPDEMSAIRKRAKSLREAPL